MSEIWASNILDTIYKFGDDKKIRGIKIFTVKSISPLVLVYENLEIGAQFGDTIYLHPLIISPLISQNIETLLEIQDFTFSTAYKSPEFKALITGTFPDFLKEFYLFFKKWQSTYILNEGDTIAVFELGGNKYLIIQKVIIS